MVWKMEDTLEQYQLMQSENDRGHKSGIDCEGELIRAVRDGDVERVKKRKEERSNSFYVEASRAYAEKI